jgi:hypothetical protein
MREFKPLMGYLQLLIRIKVIKLYCKKNLIIFKIVLKYYFCSFP